MKINCQVSLYTDPAHSASDWTFDINNVSDTDELWAGIDLWLDMNGLELKDFHRMSVTTTGLVATPSPT